MIQMKKSDKWRSHKFCKKCNLCENPRIEGDILPLVPGRGDINKADIMIVLDKPTESDQQFLTALSDARGKVVTNAVGMAGIDAERLYITHVMKHPYKGSKPTVAQYAACVPFLERELAVCKPTVVIPMGSRAIEYFTGNNEVMTQRGKAIKHADGYDVIPTMSPGSFIYSKDNKHQHFMNDIKLAKRFADGLGDYDETEVIEVKTEEDLQPFLDSLVDNPFFVYDLETNSLCGHCAEITDIGLCNEEGKAYVVQNKVWDDKVGGLVQYCDPAVFETAVSLIANPALPTGTHGGCYDYFVMLANGLLTLDEIRKSWTWDSLYLHHSSHRQS